MKKLMTEVRFLELSPKKILELYKFLGVVDEVEKKKTFCLVLTMFFYNFFINPLKGNYNIER